MSLRLRRKQMGIEPARNPKKKPKTKKGIESSFIPHPSWFRFVLLNFLLPWFSLATRIENRVHNGQGKLWAHNCFGSGKWLPCPRATLRWRSSSRGQDIGFFVVSFLWALPEPFLIFVFFSDLADPASFGYLCAKTSSRFTDASVLKIDAGQIEGIVNEIGIRIGLGLVCAGGV